MEFISSNKGALDDVASNVCQAYHRVVGWNSTQETTVKQTLDDVASNICQALH